MLTLEFGRTFRFSTSAVDVTKRNGDTVKFASGLGDFTLGTSIGAEASISFTIDAGEAVRQEPLNWAILKGEGQEFEERDGVLRRWFPGQKLEEARSWLVGTTVDAQYADPNAHVGRLVISLERRPTKGRTIPGPQERVDTFTWPVTALAVIDDMISGATYPTIKGAPGHNPSAAVPDPAVPLLLVEVQGATTDDRLLVSTGRVAAVAIELYDITNNPPLHERRLIKTMQDGLGRTVSYVDFIGSALTATPGNKYYGGFQADGGVLYGGGQVDARSGRLVRDVVTQIEVALRENGTTVDLGRMEALRARIGSYMFDAPINTAVNAFDWLRREILPLMTLVERQGEFGLYYDFEVWDASVSDVDVHLRFDVDQNAVQATAPLVKRKQSEIYNQFTIEYAPYLVGSKMLRRRILSAESGFITDVDDAGVTTDTRVFGDLRCKLSQARFRNKNNRTGVRPAPPIRAAAVRDDATALRLLRDRAARDALPKRVTQVTGGPEWEWVNEGAIGLYINSAAGCPGNVCRVDNVTVGDGLTVLDITLLDDPIQTDRLTA